MNIRNSVRAALCCAGLIALLNFAGCANTPKDEGGDTTVPSMSSVWYQVGVSNDNFISVADSANGFMADSAVHNFAAGFGCSGLPHSIAAMMMMSAPPVTPTNMSQFIAYLATKNVSTIQNFLDSRVLTRIAAVLAKLQLLETENAVITFDAVKLYNLLTGASNTGTQYVMLNSVEFYAADAALSGLAGLICLLNAHNLDVNMANLINMMTNLGSPNMTNQTFLNSVFYNPFSTSAFGTLRSIASYASAKGYLQRASAKTQHFLDAYETDRAVSSSSNIIPSGMPTTMKMVMSNIAGWMETSLNGTSVAFDLQFIFTNIMTSVDMGGVTNFYTNVFTNSFDSMGIKINLGRFFDNAPSIRDLIVVLDGAGDPVFYTTNAAHTATSPVNGGVYCLKAADTSLSFKGLFDGNLYSEMTNSALTNTGFTNTLPLLNEMLSDNGYLKLVGFRTNGTVEYIPYTNAGFTSKWLNLVTSIEIFND